MDIVAVSIKAYNMIYFSSSLKKTEYRNDADALFEALSANGEDFKLIENTKDIWLRDFMPIKTRSGKYISFRYEPSYLADKKYENLRTDYRRDVSGQFSFQVTYSNINLDGGNVVFSPSRNQVIISDRVFLENPGCNREELTAKLSELLEAQLIIIESAKSDLTGHADGMVRFLDEQTLLINRTDCKKGLEQRQEKQLVSLGFKVIKFPYKQAHGDSAKGSYLNYLETDKNIFLPMFDIPEDEIALKTAEELFTKKVVPVKIAAISEEGGVFNCISWED